MKNKFILPLIMLNMFSGLGSAFMIWYSGGDLIWLGVLLTTLPLPFLLIVLTNALGIVRTSARLPLIQLLSLGGISLVVYSLLNNPNPIETSQMLGLSISIFGAAFIQWYVWSYSNYGRGDSKALIKGTTLPNLTLTRLDGSTITSSSFNGTKTLLVFFRANWCPFCMNQLKEIKAYAEQLRKLGVQVKFISNQGIDLSNQLKQKLDLPSHFEIFQDEHLSAAKTLGIEDIGGTPGGMSAYPEDTVMATVIALDENGKLIFGDETDNYRVRPHPDDFMQVFSS